MATRRRLLLLAAAIAVCAPQSDATPVQQPDNSDCGAKYHANATHLLRLGPKAGFGVIFVAHHGNSERKKEFVQQAIASANTYCNASIRLPRTLITSAGGPPLPGAARRLSSRFAPTSPIAYLLALARQQAAGLMTQNVDRS